MTTRMPHPYALADAEGWLAEVAGEPWVLGIFRREDGAFAGIVSVEGDVESAEPVELGYWVGKPFWGQGYMTEAARHCVDRFFQATGRRVIRSSVLPENAASRRVLEKLGFRPAGTVERHMDAMGETRRLLVMELDRPVRAGT